MPAVTLASAPRFRTKQLVSGRTQTLDMIFKTVKSSRQDENCSHKRRPTGVEEKEADHVAQISSTPFQQRCPSALTALYCTDDKRNKPEKNTNVKQDNKGRRKPSGPDRFPASSPIRAPIASAGNLVNMDNTVLFS
jgi:hypothetical protein